MTTSPNTTIEGLDGLFRTLQGRHPPEQIAQIIRQLGRRDLTAAVAEVRGTRGYTYSLMTTEWDAPKPISGPVASLLEVTGDHQAPTSSVDPLELREFVKRQALRLGWTAWGDDNLKPLSFKRDRLNRRSRAALGLGGMSRRQYNKRFRLLARIHSETLDLEKQWRAYRLGVLAKTNYASRLPIREFEQDVPTAAFVAYMTSTLARRSLFTDGPQIRAFDTVAERLLQVAQQHSTGHGPNWYAIAHVFDRADVLAQVPNNKRMALLAMVHESMREAATVLKEAWDTSKFDLSTMVVHRGQDSSTWNAAAGGWNKARDYWLALIESFGMQDTLVNFMPGKVLRLMAADVTRWHQSAGEEFHPDTYVWRDLNKPWDVLLGNAVCMRADVERSCQAHGVDSEKTGWTRPFSRTVAGVFCPTPETVHGVVVDHPDLANWLRKIGAFSGQGINWDKLADRPTVGWTVHRDKDGFATGVTTESESELIER